MLLQFDFADVPVALFEGGDDGDPVVPARRGCCRRIFSRSSPVRGPVRADYVSRKTSLDGARALRRSACASLHAACIDFNQQARNAFRKNPTVMECLERLPTNDKSFQQTLDRADMALVQWAALPLVGTPPAVFSVAQGVAVLTLAGMTALHAAAETADGDMPAAEQDFLLQQARLHGKQAEMHDQMMSALRQGRSQFPKGSAEREVIEGDPDEGPEDPWRGGGGRGGAAGGAVGACFALRGLLWLARVSARRHIRAS
jgi:hypothetical protein